ncbi:helix-turn-helix transcriptional regulator [Corynebacterium cystitidis]|uniref:Predicted transcriptional regulator, ArsR family n=1 Tax=Corynebacterium cystitidis DSM 20524 TaxID=1121357 RepID=A0A1H9S0A9_9CORY|nr:MarR family transcriptional regulator [Corynebacterium cystitidis]WJY82162.1 MarR family protein [Corynebacterium cystitidis DSM 20524]SER78427.1 Predicted transcriptional regulator, ArsR family [Corynebacterium cystitidis DSM 20524]SNV78384.1 Aerobic repressor of nitrate reductase R [Corynebacterium cystitidis]
MDSITYPRPATDLLPEMLKLSPKQTEVLATLQSFPRGARAADIAERLGMHVNTARGHLDELVAKDAVRVTSAPAAGRGRPSLIFQVRVPDNRTIAEEHIELIELLVGLVENSSSSDEAVERARAVGAQWAATIKSEEETWSTAADTIAGLNQRLREMGFDPQVVEHGTHCADDPISDSSPSAEITLHSCPFVSADGTTPSPFICAVHEGFLQERIARYANDHVNLELKRYTPTETCTVKVFAPNTRDVAAAN